MLLFFLFFIYQTILHSHNITNELKLKQEQERRQTTNNNRKIHTMPRHRPRAQILRALRKENRKREAAAYVRHILEDLDDSDGDSDSDGSCDDGLQQDLIDMQLKNAEKVISSRRFLFRKSKYRNRLQYFDEIDCVSPDSKRFNDEEFLIHFRMCRSSFHAIVELIKDSKYFKNKPGRKKKASVEFHLLVFLQKMGSEGTEGNHD